MKYLVTGGAGFIGSNIVRRLLKEKNARIVVFDNFSTGKRENLTDFVNDRRVEIIEGDLRDSSLIIEASRGVDIIFHEAALPSVTRSVKAPFTTNDVNVTGTLKLLQSARINHVRRVIYASSSSIYGDSKTLPKTEDMKPNPLSPYAVSKLAGEYYMNVYNRLYGIETVILRYFNVYGPYQDPNSEYSGVIAKFIKAFMNNQQITVYGDGEQSRDFTYVDDVVEANILAAKSKISGEVFNVAGGNRHSLNYMIGILKKIFNKKEYPVIYTKFCQGDIKHSQAGVEKIKKNLNFITKINFKNGIKKTKYFLKLKRSY
jgi:nucleoside-diphosphate-sugar epimerase